MEGASGDDWISGAQIDARLPARRGDRRRHGASSCAPRVSGALADQRRQRRAAHPADPVGRARRARAGSASWCSIRSSARASSRWCSPPTCRSRSDRPIDFGLQTFCSNCLKCARECPCDAIPFGDKVMFNGYEIWKPDVERCTRYRLTNAKGSACGRCMKTCPINKVVDADGALLDARRRAGSASTRMWLKPLLVPIATRHGRLARQRQAQSRQEMVVRS